MKMLLVITVDAVTPKIADTIAHACVPACKELNQFPKNTTNLAVPERIVFCSDEQFVRLEREILCNGGTPL